MCSIETHDGTPYEVPDENAAVIFYPTEGDPQALEVSPETGYERELRYFTECMENNQRPERVLPESAQDSVGVVLAEKESVRTGAPVELS